MRCESKGQPHKHILTVVLEDYCHVGPVRRVVPPGYWHRFESRVARNTAVTLDLLDEVGAKATFFVLGWVADHQPEVVAEVTRRGHEVATKGYFHRSIREMAPEEFRNDAVRSREALERATGAPVHGYRIARGWFSHRDLWALDALSEEGFEYDSSVLPLGFEFSREPFRRVVHRHESRGRSIWELPISSCKFGPILIPVSGGNYVRQLPETFVRRAIAQWDQTVSAPLVFYFHVWELDPEQPRITAAPPIQRIRQYRNLEAMGQRIRYYLTRYSFTSVSDYLDLPPAAVKAPHAAAASVNILNAVSASPAQSRPDVAPASTSAATARRAVTIVVPCYNEEVTLGYLANTLDSFAAAVANEYELRYVFVDDGSADHTWERLNELFGARPDCRVLRHPENRGIAAATMTGIRESATDIVCSIDADGTFDPHQLKSMIPLLTPGVDVVTASPYHPLGQVVNVPGWRLVLSKGASKLYNFLLHNKLYSYTSCFRVYRRSAVADLTLKDQRYVGITEILSQLDMRGAGIVEYPAVIEVRLLGHSKMKILKTIGGHLKLMSRLAAERWLQSVNPKHSVRRGSPS